MFVDTRLRSRFNTNPCKEENIKTQESHHCNHLIVNVMSKPRQFVKTQFKQQRVVIITREETLTKFDKNMVSTLLLGFWASTLHGNGSQN